MSELGADLKENRRFVHDQLTLFVPRTHGSDGSNSLFNIPVIPEIPQESILNFGDDFYNNWNYVFVNEGTGGCRDGALRH